MVALWKTIWKIKLNGVTKIYTKHLPSQFKLLIQNFDHRLFGINCDRLTLQIQLKVWYYKPFLSCLVDAIRGQVKWRPRVNYRGRTGTYYKTSDCYGNVSMTMYNCDFSTNHQQNVFPSQYGESSTYLLQNVLPFYHRVFTNQPWNKFLLHHGEFSTHHHQNVFPFHYGGFSTYQW